MGEENNNRLTLIIEHYIENVSDAFCKDFCKYNEFMGDDCDCGHLEKCPLLRFI